MTHESYDVQETGLLFENLRHPVVDPSKNLSTFFIFSSVTATFPDVSDRLAVLWSSL